MNVHVAPRHAAPSESGPAVVVSNLVRSYGDSAYYTHSSGAGVFNAGTTRWVRSMGGHFNDGTHRRCAAFTRQVTSNVLRAFAAGPAAAKYPAHDNLGAMDEWAGDPIAAGYDLWPPVQL